MRLAIQALSAFLISALCLLPAVAHAATFRITLADGTEIVGDIRDFEDGIYTIDAGRQRRQARVSDLKSIEPVMVTSSTARPALPGSAAIPEFAITTANGRVVVGRIQSFEEGVYEVMTRAGLVSVAVWDVRRMELSWVERQPVAIAPGKPLAPGSVRITGADAVATLYLPAILDAYSGAGGGRDPLWSRGPQSTLRTFSTTAPGRGKFVAEVRSAHSKDGVQALAGRQTDIALMSRRMLPEEVRALSGRGLGNMYAPQQEHELAPTAIAVVVHRSNPLKSLTREQIADIFSGKVRNWSEVGGSSRRIQVFAPADGSGILDVFRGEMLGGRELLGTATRLHTDAEISDTVSIDAASIGLVEYSAVGNAAALALVDGCGRPVAPTPFSIQTREYPLLTSHYLYVAGKAPPPVRDFFDFAVSPSGQQALRHGGLPNTLPMLRPADEPALPNPPATVWPVSTGGVAGKVEQFLAAATRVSVAVRFGDGIQLATDADAEIARLARFVKDGSEARRLVLLGFSDTEGDLAASVRLSERRARLVERRLKAHGVEVEQAFGLGPLRPVACGGPPPIRARNRRVEAWLM